MANVCASPHPTMRFANWTHTRPPKLGWFFFDTSSHVYNGRFVSFDTVHRKKIFHFGRIKIAFFSVIYMKILLSACRQRKKYFMRTYQNRTFLRYIYNTSSVTNMSKNSNLHKAKTTKNDEFYTQLVDIENEVRHYKEHFKGKVVYCNCDDAKYSNFFKYFSDNFDELGLGKVIASCCKQDGKGQLYVMNGGVSSDDRKVEVTELDGNGDFRSDECIELLKEADIVVTNPPFSLFREFITLLSEHNKKFLVIGSMNAITYKEVFPMIKDDKLWLGVNKCKYFIQPDGCVVKFGNIGWFTNLEHDIRNRPVELYMTYSNEYYHKYDNYDAIDVSRTKDIPMDYDGVMGVPISFLDKYNPNQFEIVKFRKGDDDKDLCVNGKCPYFRILIRHRK